MIEFQPLSDSVYNKKYQLFDKYGDEVDHDRLDTFRRVAIALAKNEKDPDYWTDQFYTAMVNGAIPAGRILSNAGAEKYKPNTSLINCTLSRIVEDSITGIGEAVKEAMVTLSSGAGIGYEFSTLRPRGAFVNGVGSSTSGPLPFADVFDKACFTIASAGGRRGAQMATFDIRHPDVVDFIKIKREDGRFRQFNISVLVSDEFMDFNNKTWDFRFPGRRNDPDFEICSDEKNSIFDYWHVEDCNYICNENGLTLFKKYNKIDKKELWDLMLKATYDYAEPGVIFVDRVNRENNLYFCEELRSTNPCSEVPLPPFGSCLLGSIDLTKFVSNPFTEEANFNFEQFKAVVAVFTRMLDNVVEMSGLPLQEQRNELWYKRRHGMGIMGLGTVLTMLRLKYGSRDSFELANRVMKDLAIVGYQTGLELAKEKGAAPVMDVHYQVTKQMTRFHPELESYVGKVLRGKELFVKSHYMQRLFSTGELNENDFLKYGCRFSHHTAIAPTGTISLAMCNNISGGLEPSFSHQYFRNLTVEGKKTRQQESVYSYEFLAYKNYLKDYDFNGKDFTDEQLLKRLPDYFVTADSLSWKDHVNMLALLQKWTDQGCSKTVNCPTSISFEEFKDVYQYAYDQGCKSVATYRYNPETLGAILSRNEDLENTKYQFTLQDGTVVECKGIDKIEYDGEVTTAENLYNALKEKSYNKF